MSHPLEPFEGPLHTRMGACFPGERTVFRGVDLHQEFQSADWIDLYIFSITGRRLPANALKVLQSVWVYTSYPDPRLWNNRVAAMTGSARGTGAQALGAALAVSEAAIFGRHPEITAADFLVRARDRMDQGEALEDIVRAELAVHKRMMGYGRPVAADYVDERIPVTLAMMEREKLPMGPYLQLAFEIEAVLEKIVGRRLPMTYSSVVVAIPLDLGMSPRECYLYMQPSFVAGMIPCYLEALERPEGATFALRCDRIQYDGPPRRNWDADANS
ncbi:MAG: citryl-CoA lyase [Pseudomonadota bacterium]